MSAISLPSFNSFRSSQGAAFPPTQQPQRGAVSGAFNVAGAARGGNVNSANGNSSAYCPTCVGGGAARSGASSSSSYCPTCNQAGGRQSNITNTGARAGAAQTTAAHNHQGGRICVGCAYQGR